MVEQIHRRLSDEQVKMILDRYVKKELGTEQAMNLLGLKRSQFFELVKKYRETPDGFTIEYSRRWSNRKIGEDVTKNILKELKIEKVLIDDPAMPIRFYNYSFIKNQLVNIHF